MGRKGVKVSAEQKLKYAQLCFEGKMSIAEACRILDIRKNHVAEWVLRYREQGPLGFQDTGKNNVYSPELKLQAVQSYLNGEGSYALIAAKYGLRESTQLRTWVKMYNNGDNFSRKMLGGSRMTTSRPTTKEERIKIVMECIAHGYNYGEIAIKYNVSYQQVYGWVQRFKELGEAGLEDRRGRRKLNQEPRSEMEKLQIENERLKHQLYMAEMERDLLKKLNELERENPSHK